MKRLFIVKILMIEDSTIARKTVKEGLRNFNFDFLEAADGESGIKTALNEKPDIILLDLNLPDMLGHEILTRLRHEKATASTPVIVISTSKNTDDVEKCIKAGAQYYFVKPVDIGKLLAKITQLLNITETEISSYSFQITSSAQSDSSSDSLKKTVSFSKSASAELKPGMVLGISVVSTDGKVLAKQDTALDEKTIQTIISHDINFVYIKPAS